MCRRIGDEVVEAGVGHPYLRRGDEAPDPPPPKLDQRRRRLGTGAGAARCGSRWRAEATSSMFFLHLLLPRRVAPAARRASSMPPPRFSSHRHAALDPVASNRCAALDSATFNRCAVGETISGRERGCRRLEEERRHRHGEVSRLGRKRRREGGRELVLFPRSRFSPRTKRRARK
jgi:hypothetical protein